MNNRIDDLCINAIRISCVDAINKAKSGHPGIALGAAGIMHTLFTRHLLIDPKNPDWVNRDRFILSAGHGSIMLYATLHLSGADISLNDLKKFRVFGSKTPGHPEVFHTPCIEATTGPLGQGVAMGVGMAICEDITVAKFNKYNNQIFDHYTYVLCGDGDLQEGVCQESLSLAGTLQLKKLIVLYDSNDVQLDGEVSMVNTENVRLKYEAMGFDYFLVEDGTDCDEISAAIDAAKSSLKPSLIEIKTQIGYGSPLAGDCSSHGAPLGQANTLELKEYLEWTYDEFEIPEECYEFYNKNVTVRGEKANTLFNKMLSEYQDEYPDDYVELEQYLNDDYVLDLSALRKYNLDFSEPTKNISGHAIADISMQLPFVVGGCADVVNTTKARGSNGNYSVDNRVGRNIMYGVREFAMGAIANAITLYHGFRGFAGCFLVFSDYMKPALRLAALMKTPTVFTFSHDTIAVGEDGPTHQPIEQLTMLRSIPNFNVIRSCDANETNYGYQIAFNSKTTPTAIITTRQALPTLPNTSYNLVAKGAYNVFTPSNEEDVVVVACGSEVHLALDVAKELEQAGVYVRVVSMPSMFLFDQQSDKYKETILPKDKKIIALEMGHPMCWYKYTPYVYGIDTFGESGPAKAVLNKFGFTTEKFKGYVLKIIG